MTFADPRVLRAKQLAALHEELERAGTDEERERIQARIREVTRGRWSRLLFPHSHR